MKYYKPTTAEQAEVRASELQVVITRLKREQATPAQIEPFLTELSQVEHFYQQYQGRAIA